MTTHKTFHPPGAPDAAQPPSTAERLEDDAVLAGVVAADTARAVEVAGVGLIGLLVCPPLAVLVFLLVVPFLVVALAVALIIGIFSTPYLLFHHLRAPDRRHMSLLGQRFRRAAHALVDLAPHRIVADARKPHPHP
jgi:hypothetical protein